MSFGLKQPTTLQYTPLSVVKCREECPMLKTTVDASSRKYYGKFCLDAEGISFHPIAPRTRQNQMSLLLPEGWQIKWEQVAGFERRPLKHGRGDAVRIHYNEARYFHDLLVHASLDQVFAIADTYIGSGSQSAA